MLPILFSIGPLTLYTYGVVVFIASLLALFVIFKRGRELRLPEDQLFDVLFVSILFSFLVGRIGYVASNWTQFNAEIWQILNIFGSPGIGEISAFVGLVFGIWWQSRTKKWDFYELLDVIVVGIAIWQALLGFGDFLNGSKAGLPTRWPIGVRFANFYENRLPIQLWDMVSYSILFYWLWKVESKYRTFSWFKGQKSQANSGFIASMYLIIHGFIGFTASNFRPQTLQLFSIPITPFLYLFVMLAGGILLFYRSGINIRKSLKDWFGMTPLIPRE